MNNELEHSSKFVLKSLDNVFEVSHALGKREIYETASFKG